MTSVRLDVVVHAHFKIHFVDLIALGGGSVNVASKDVNDHLAAGSGKAVARVVDGHQIDPLMSGKDIRLDRSDGAGSGIIHATVVVGNRSVKHVLAFASNDDEHVVTDDSGLVTAAVLHRSKGSPRVADGVVLVKGVERSIERIEGLSRKATSAKYLAFEGFAAQISARGVDISDLDVAVGGGVVFIGDSDRVVVVVVSTNQVDVCAHYSGRKVGAEVGKVSTGSPGVGFDIVDVGDGSRGIRVQVGFTTKDVDLRAHQLTSVSRARGWDFSVELDGLGGRGDVLLNVLGDSVLAVVFDGSTDEEDILIVDHSAHVRGSHSHVWES